MLSGGEKALSLTLKMVVIYAVWLGVFELLEKSGLAKKFAKLLRPLNVFLFGKVPEKANDFMRDNVTDTEYYILFKDKNADMLQKRIRTVILGLSNCGLDSAQVSNSDLRVILDNFLNGGMTTENKAVLPSGI